MSEQFELDFNPPVDHLPQLWTPDDIFRAASADVIRQFAEDSRVERKPSAIHARELGEYVSMWANTQPHGGIVFIGVEDKGRISGCRKLSTESLNKLETVRRYCPDARQDFRRIPVTNSDGVADFVIVLRVFYREDRLVETTDGNAYVPNGQEKRKLLETEKREIRINKGEVEYELEPTQLRWPEDFDTLLVDQLASSYFEKRRLTRRLSREEILSLIHLGRLKANREFEPNMACALVCAKDPRKVIPGARLRIIRYDGVEEAFGKNLNQTFDTFVDGPIPNQILEAEKLIAPLMRNFIRLGADSRFHTRPEYPREVWLEAIVNACVHRSYNLKYMNVFIKIFENRIVVESPGGFLPPTTAETVYDSHNPRNPYTMEALFYMDFVHCGYEGTRRMRAGMAEANLPPPEFNQKQVGANSVHVTLKNSIEHRRTFLNSGAASVVGAALYETLSEHERLVINFVAEHGKASVSDTSRLIGRDWHAAKTVLQGLVDRKVFLLQSKTGKERESSKRYVLRESK